MKRTVSNSIWPIMLMILICSGFSAHPQKNTWTWLGGDPLHATSPAYSSTQAWPELGPGAREGVATAWYGNKLYLFGGITANVGFDANYYSRNHITNSYRDDYWELDLSTGKWTVLGGTIANYTSKDWYAHLSPRYGATLWATASHLFVFGGRANIGSPGDGEGDYYDDGGCYAERSDLWAFDLQAKSWTKLKVNNSGGDIYNAGVYGTKGVAATNNTPGARKWSAGWTANNKLYLFGGESRGSCFNDLWEYDPATNRWRWLTGSNSAGAAGAYGTTGVPNSANSPGARMQAAMCGAGNKLWLFGGTGFGESGKGYLNDLWEYDIDSNEWKWIGGDKIPDVNGEYGTQGQPAGANKPGGRGSANLWWWNGLLWAGMGNGKAESTTGLLNDLWSFNPGSGQWTWLKGAKVAGTPGNYPPVGQATSQASPGARWQAGGWIMNGQLACFGGFGIDSSSRSGRMDDLWTFDPTTRYWTWQQGHSNNDINYYKRGRYGTKGVAAASNHPGARHSAMTWQANDLFYLLGGEGSDRDGNYGLLNDLWEYNPDNQRWKWVAGSDIANDGPVYGTKGIFGASNSPGPRTKAATWSARGKLYMMGGYGKATSAQPGVLNDLWVFDLGTQQWAWISGADTLNAVGIYGQRGVAGPDNAPRARQATGQWLLNGKLYLFGGASYNELLNDLWEYDLATGQWRWLSGMDNSYSPPWRSHPHSWVINGKLLLTGGYINQYGGSLSGTQLDDHWLFDPVNGNWTQTGTGTPGYHANGTHNGAYRTLSTDWTLANGTYLFAGQANAFFTQSVACCTEVYYRSGMFPEMNGGISTGNKMNDSILITGGGQINSKGIYPSTPVPGTGHFPGARRDGTGWSQPGQLFLFGGYGTDASRMFGTLDDLWVFNLCDSVKPADTSGTSLIDDIHSTPHFGTNPFNIVATIMPSGAQPIKGAVQARLWIDATEQRYNGKAYSRRHFEFQPAENAANATATVTLYFTQAEFDSFNTAGVSRKLPVSPSDASGKSNLRISKIAGLSNDGSGAFSTYSGTEHVIDPDDNRIAWNSTHGRWEISFETTGFSGFFLHSYESGLPISGLHLDAQSVPAGVALQWKSNADQVKSFVVERSQNGIQFNTLAKLNHNHIFGTTFNYVDTKDNLPTTQVLYYRIRQQQLDGQVVFSNVASVHLANSTRPLLVAPNPATSVISIQYFSTTSEKVLVRLTDVAGRTVQNQTYEAGRGYNQLFMNVHTLPRGVYSVVVQQGGQLQTTAMLKQ